VFGARLRCLLSSVLRQSVDECKAYPDCIGNARCDFDQEELAHRSGLARSFTGAIERGEKDVRLSTLVKLADTFGVPITGLFG